MTLSIAIQCKYLLFSYHQVLIAHHLLYISTYPFSKTPHNIETILKISRLYANEM